MINSVAPISILLHPSSFVVSARLFTLLPHLPTGLLSSTKLRCLSGGKLMLFCSHSFLILSVAAEDVGLNVNDLDDVNTFTRYTTCISETRGGSGNPSVATGKGTFSS